jgi:photosystem II stability/assembly factor-like uncharacterized protein
MRGTQCRLSLRLLALVLCSSASLNSASVIYLGTSVGPYKSTDSGATFVPLAAKIGMNPHPLLRGIPTISDIAIDPKDSRIVYMIGGYEGRTTALLKTTDAGERWTATPLANVSWHTRILIDAIATNVVYLHDEENQTGLRSLDSGGTWAPIAGLPGNRIWELATDPKVTRILYARLGGSIDQQEPVYKSLDYGFTWTAIGATPNAGGGRIYVDPRNSRHLILTTSGPCSAGSGSCGPFRSTDGGVTWKKQEQRRVEGVQWSTIRKPTGCT